MEKTQTIEVSEEGLKVITVTPAVAEKREEKLITGFEIIGLKKRLEMLKFQKDESQKRVDRLSSEIESIESIVSRAKQENIISEDVNEIENEK